MNTNNNIYLMGFMAVGKTKIGHLLSEKLKRDYFDTDDLIIEKAGMSIPDIFDQLGEPRFRDLETEVIQEVSRQNGLIIALGGGAVVRDENWEMIKQSGATITLSYPPEIIAQRVARNKNRPLLSQDDPEERMEKIKSLMTKRVPYYQRADLVLHLNHEITAGQVVAAILGYLGHI